MGWKTYAENKGKLKIVGSKEGWDTWPRLSPIDSIGGCCLLKK